MPGDPSLSDRGRADEPDYPFHGRTVRVTRCGRICMGKRKINLCSALAGQIIGIREVDDAVWLVSFLDYGLGVFDNEVDRVEPGPNPFTPEKAPTISPE
jgi:putative transposase